MPTIQEQRDDKGVSPLLMQVSTSPNHNAIFRLQVQLVAGRDVVGLVPCLDIADRIASIFPRRMSVGFDLPAKGRFALNFPPPLGKRQEKSLLASQSTDDNIWFAFQRQDIGVMRRQQACEVGDIFGQDLLASDAKIRKRAISVELRH